LALQKAIGKKDLVQLLRDDYVWGRFTETVAAQFHPDFESANALPGVATTYQGVDRLRTIWLDWLRPWASYRARWRSSTAEIVWRSSTAILDVL
jgi:hypothetical protein